MATTNDPNKGLSTVSKPTQTGAADQSKLISSGTVIKSGAGSSTPVAETPAYTPPSINDIYDSSLATQNQSLQSAYLANMAAQAEQQQKARQDYGTAAYDLGVQNDRNDKNLTQFADVRGLNYDGGSQHALSLGNARASSAGALAAQQAAAIAESQRQEQLRTLEYQNQVAAALADNDYKRAAALMDDYQNQQKRQEQQAQLLASYGNFDMYKSLYGDDTAGSMQTMWNAQNPETAYRLGRISAKQYKNITGKWPRGYNPPSSGGGGYYGGSSSTQLKLAGKQSFNASKKTSSGHGGGTHTPKGVGPTKMVM